jgi:hypothetical protein
VSERLPPADHAHAQAQKILDEGTREICSDRQLQNQLDVYLDCEFLESYLRWTGKGSEWLEEAYVTYVAGAKDSKYEWQATNLLRSVDLFSTRPIVVVVFGVHFVPPLSWRSLPNVIVFRMHSVATHRISFNFNKIRSMIAARVVVGIQLDTDQIIAPGMDQLFTGTRREITAYYPWPMLPVHWMSRDARPGEPYHEYAFRFWGGARTMRWGHAHPSWSIWAVPFLCDMLLERYMASLAGATSKLKVWNLPEATKSGLLEVLAKGNKVQRSVRFDGWMQEDEDMLNVGLWRDGVHKEWCKYDLEFGLFKMRYDLENRLYWDAKWYPEGIPVIFISMHNTKRFEETDWILYLVAMCERRRPQLSAECGRGRKYPPNFCKEVSTEERRYRQRPLSYASYLC